MHCACYTWFDEHTRVLFSQMINFQSWYSCHLAVMMQSRHRWCNNGAAELFWGCTGSGPHSLLRHIGFTSLASKDKNPELFFLTTSLSEDGLCWYWCGALQTPNLVKGWDGDHTQWTEKGSGEQGVWHLFLGHGPAQCWLHDPGSLHGLSGHLHDVPVDQQEEEPWTGWWIVTLCQFVNPVASFLVVINLCPSFTYGLHWKYAPLCT